MRKRRLTHSLRANAPERRKSRCSKPAPASARHSAIWRLPACGPRRTAPGCGFRPIRAICSARSCRRLARLYPDPAERDEKAVMRKGRENYLCLLNFEEAAKRTALAPGQRMVALGLIARWIAASADGDISGAGFPSFLAATVPVGEFTDRRGECIYAACAHYRVCFIERAIRRSRRAPIVVANHALVIAQAAQRLAGRRRDQRHAAGTSRALRVRRRPSSVRCGGFGICRIRFRRRDGGVAPLDPRLRKGARAAACPRPRRTAQGFRRRKTRPRGSRWKKRSPAASALAGEGWMSRVNSGQPRGGGEAFLAAAYVHVSAQSDERESFYSREAGTETLWAN